MWKRTGKYVIGVGVLMSGLWLGAVAVSPSAAQEEGIAERIGGTLDRGINKLKEGWAEARSSVERMGVQGRVYGRLRWDKELEGAELDVDIREGREVVLKGTVPSAAAKKKAVQLAQDTIGVESLVDQLRIAGADR